MTLEVNATSMDVAAFHNNSDVDAGTRAQHHTLGRGPFQAAPGNLSYSKAETDALLTKNRVLALATANTAIPAGGWSILNNLIPFFAVGISISGGTSLNFSKAGLYRITATVYYDSVTVGYRASRWNTNVGGTITQSYVAFAQAGSGAFVNVVNSILINVTAGGLVWLEVGAETAMNARGSTTGFGLSRIEAEEVF